MTLVEQFHAEHKARRARFAAAAQRKVIPIAEPAPQTELVPVKRHDPFASVVYDLKVRYFTPSIVRPEVVFGQPVTCRNIARVVAAFYGVTFNDIISGRRHKEIIMPRHISMYLCRTMLTCSLPEIGRRLGGRDHTTCLHGIRKIERLLPIDARLADDIDLLKIKINEFMAHPHVD